MNSIQSLQKRKEDNEYGIVLRVDARTFVNNHDSVFVGKLHRLLRVRIVRGAIRIGAQPAQQIKVFGEQRQIQALAANLRITNVFL